VVLDDDPRPVRAAACEATAANALRLTLTEGKYHQVKRMLAAVGNRVTQLHRSRIGTLELPADLAPGQWRWLTPEQLARAVSGDGARVDNASCRKIALIEDAEVLVPALEQQPDEPRQAAAVPPRWRSCSARAGIRPWPGSARAPLQFGAPLQRAGDLLVGPQSRPRSGSRRCGGSSGPCAPVVLALAHDVARVLAGTCTASGRRA
jgi:hypothetical protein